MSNNLLLLAETRKNYIVNKQANKLVKVLLKRMRKYALLGYTSAEFDCRNQKYLFNPHFHDTLKLATSMLSDLGFTLEFKSRTLHSDPYYIITADA